MNPNPIKLKIDRWELDGLRTLIHTELEVMHQRIEGFKGADYLVYKVLAELDLKYAGKIKRSDRHDRKYDITIDKAEAWVLFFHFNNRIEEYHPVKNLLGVFHQQLCV